MTPTNTFRRLAFKDPSVAQETATRYGLTLNSDGTINWPVVRKGDIKLSEQELLGIPKGERNQVYKTPSEEKQIIESILNNYKISDKRVQKSETRPDV